MVAGSAFFSVFDGDQTGASDADGGRRLQDFSGRGLTDGCIYLIIESVLADVAELADAQASGACGLTPV